MKKTYKFMWNLGVGYLKSKARLQNDYNDNDNDNNDNNNYNIKSY